MRKGEIGQIADGDVADVQFPEYFLTRPTDERPVDFTAFERLYAEQVEPGHGRRIDYQLQAPRWRFLCWLTDTKGVLVHGSASADVAEFEPRQPQDTSEFGGQRAVFAASDGIWAMFFAIVDRKVATSLVNMSVVALTDGAEAALYYFSVNQEALAGSAWRSGTVYVLPADTFHRQPDSQREGVTIRSNQWASPAAVRPLASLTVAPVDFPFLEHVNGHDQRTVAARAAEDPEAFPWRN